VFEFVADRIIKNRMYPALALHEARPLTQAWREFGLHWPFTTSARLEEYCQYHQWPYHISLCQDPPGDRSWYVIGLAFFDFTVDYIGLLPQQVKQRLGRGDLRLLFCYHEGDNPRRIKQRLDQLCAAQDLPSEVYYFITANTAGQDLPRFRVFHDFELWYGRRNVDHRACEAHTGPRDRDFTVLCRLHKNWRAAIMASLLAQGLLDNSYWSYGQCVDGDLRGDNPIEIDLIPGVVGSLLQFRPPYACDDLDQSQHNDHGHLVRTHHENSYCNIVLESQFDVDQSRGVFLTEKTFKPIKHGQLFFVAGAAGSLAVLRDLGYCVFDDVLDNGYDLIQDHTQRCQALIKAIAQARYQGLHEIYQQCVPDILHNQQLFQAAPSLRLSKLEQSLNEDS